MVKKGNTEKIREALKAARVPKTCRELMEQAGIKKADYKFAASILVGFQKSGKVLISGVKECKVSGREANVFEWDRDAEKARQTTKQKVEPKKKATPADVQAAAPAADVQPPVAAPADAQAAAAAPAAKKVVPKKAPPAKKQVAKAKKKS